MCTQCGSGCSYDRSNVSCRQPISVAMLLSLILSTSGGGKLSFYTAHALLLRSSVHKGIRHIATGPILTKSSRCTTPDSSSKRQLPAWCTLEVYGYAHQDDKVPIATAISSFIPKDGAIIMPMLQTILPPSFTTLARVEFNVIATKPTLYLDNVKYRTTNVTDTAGGLKTFIHGHETSQSEFQMRLESSDGSP